MRRKRLHTCMDRREGASDVVRERVRGRRVQARSSLAALAGDAEGRGKDWGKEGKRKRARRQRHEEEEGKEERKSGRSSS